QSNWKIGIGGLFLCEYYAFLKDKNQTFSALRIHRALERVMEETFKRMEPSGGWGHTPTIKNPLGYVELEVVSNWMLMSVGAMERLGIKPPDAELKKALQFVDDCCAPGQGAVGYSPRPGQKGMRDSPCRTGGAIFAFAALDQKKHPL